MKDSLAEQVFRALEQEILNGVRCPGDALTELGLCEKYQVSRTPVREAMRRLEAAGLVSVQPNRSAVVAGVSVQDMLDIYEIRMRVEGLAARWSEADDRAFMAGFDEGGGSGAGEEQRSDFRFLGHCRRGKRAWKVWRVRGKTRRSQS